MISLVHASLFLMFLVSCVSLVSCFFYLFTFLFLSFTCFFSYALVSSYVLGSCWCQVVHEQKVSQPLGRSSAWLQAMKDNKFSQGSGIQQLVARSGEFQTPTTWAQRPDWYSKTDAGLAAGVWKAPAKPKSFFFSAAQLEMAHPLKGLRCARALCVD